jgi:hypothetical protein
MGVVNLNNVVFTNVLDNAVFNYYKNMHLYHYIIRMYTTRDLVLFFRKYRKTAKTDSIPKKKIMLS